jgi:hypothetical protein
VSPATLDLGSGVLTAFDLDERFGGTSCDELGVTFACMLGFVVGKLTPSRGDAPVVLAWLRRCAYDILFFTMTSAVTSAASAGTSSFAGLVKASGDLVLDGDAISLEKLILTAPWLPSTSVMSLLEARGRLPGMGT